MLVCESCSVQEATFHYSSVEGGGVVNSLHYCDKCAEEHGFSVRSPEVGLGLPTPAQAWEDLGIVLINGRFHLISMSAQRQWHFIDQFTRPHALYVVTNESRGFAQVVEEFESIINSEGIREQDLHDFFQRNPDFILTEDYQRAHSKVVLEDQETSNRLIPDFMLEPVGANPLCDLLELKLPSAKVMSGGETRRRLSACVMEACAQLQTYREFFELAENRERLQERYAINAFRPRMFVLIGRRGAMDPLDLRRAEDLVPGVIVRTYDQVLDRALHRLKKLGKVRRVGNAEQ